MPARWCVRRGAPIVLVVAVLTVLAGCDDVGPAVRPSPRPTAVSQATAVPQGSAPPHAAAGGAARNLAMGTGEARNPEAFTIEQRLLAAVSKGDRVTIERALERGATVHVKDDLGRSTVALAVMDAGDLELVRWLHGKGAALDEADVSGRAAVSWAAAQGRLDLVRYLVDKGAVADRPDVQRRTPLFHAALNDQRDIVAYLAERGADVNTSDQFGDTPLIVACARGNTNTAALLLERGADATVKDQEGRTAKQRAAAEADVCRRLPQ